MNLRTGAAVAERVDVASNPWTRGVGLLGRASVADDEGLWIAGCAAVHTLFMRATIDLVFLDRDDTIVRYVPGVAPGRLQVSARRATTVLELGASAAPRDLRVGDRLTFA